METVTLAERRPKPATILEEGGDDARRAEALARDKRATWRRQCRQDITEADARRLEAIAAAEAAGRRMQEAIAAAQRAERDIDEAARGLGRSMPIVFGRETERRLSHRIAALLKPLVAGQGYSFGELEWMTSAPAGEAWAEAERRATDSAIRHLLQEDATTDE